MNVLLLAEASSAITRAMTAAASPFPPSFDNNPLIFGWALFARLLIFSLSAATIVAIRSRNLSEKISANHPVYYHRMVTVSFLWALVFGSLSDVLTYLFWNEVSNRATQVILLLSRLLDAMTMFPFLMALFVPFWLRWLCRIGVLRVAPSITLNGVVNDVRVTWSSVAIPLKLLAYSAIGSAIVTAVKYLAWIEHGTR